VTGGTDGQRPATPADIEAAVREGQTVPWLAFLAETTGRLRADGIGAADQEARWLLEEVTGLDGAEWVLECDQPATQRGVARLDDLVARRLAGEPIQYVLGRWGFRSLDLLCDRRALIPRPETEQVVEVALAELDAVLLARPVGHRAVVADLGTGTGAIALSIATERPGTDVWAADVSPDAMSVARANLSGLGMAGSRVRLAEGSWFDAMPDDLAGRLDLVVSNPPYVAAHEELSWSVAAWEPAGALVPGPTGLEAYEILVRDAARWLGPGGALVLEIGTSQARAVTELAASAGLIEIRVEPDLAGHDRTLVARRTG
jgi:release factor glutamine methyltransferase